MTMKGLTARWSLTGAPAGTTQALEHYVATQSHARFSGMDGLRFKTWRMLSGQWFEGCYVFASAEDRQRFQDTFAAGAADSPVSQIVGSAPILIEPCSVLAIAEGGAGFVSAAEYDS